MIRNSKKTATLPLVTNKVNVRNGRRKGGQICLLLANVGLVRAEPNGMTLYSFKNCANSHACSNFARNSGSPRLSRRVSSATSVRSSA